MSLSEVTPPIHMVRPRWKVIISETCIEFGIPSEALLAPYGPRRWMPARVTLARRLASAGYGYAQIGRWMHRNHATVIWYCGRKKSPARPVVNGGTEALPPPRSIYITANKRRETLIPWLKRWVTARALATAIGYEYDRVRADLKAMAKDGLVVRSGEDRPHVWRLK